VEYRDHRKRFLVSEMVALFDGGSYVFYVEVSQSQHVSYILRAAVTFLDNVVLYVSL
jgi:hypothetical protein